MLRKILRKTIDTFRELLFIPRYLSAIRRTRGTAAAVTLRTIFYQKILGFNRMAYWPTHPSTVVSSPENILIGTGTAPGLANGCYIQGLGKIYIGDYTIIAPNVGIISANHNLYDHRKHETKEVRIGKYCWLGMNSVILPGVTLGNHVVVAANSVVTHSFPEGYVVLAGSPAKVIKSIEPDKCVDFENVHRYIGYIRADKFARYRKKYLHV